MTNPGTVATAQHLHFHAYPEYKRSGVKCWARCPHTGR